MVFKKGDQKGKKNHCYKHGMTHTPTWNSWSAMHGRCKGQGNSGHLYVDVKICKRWNEFKNFYDDMGKRPKGRTLDRIDGHKGYKPSNCRWATNKQQAANKIREREFGMVYRNSSPVTFKGKTKTVSGWARDIGISLQTLRYRLEVWPKEKALMKKKRVYKKRRS